MIDSKQEGHTARQAPAPTEQPGQILDLTAALQESVAKAKASRGEDTGDADVHGLPKTESVSKKATASAKKTAAVDAPGHLTALRADRLRGDSPGNDPDAARTELDFLDHQAIHLREQHVLPAHISHGRAWSQG